MVPVAVVRIPYNMVFMYTIGGALLSYCVWYTGIGVAVVITTVKSDMKIYAFKTGCKPMTEEHIMDTH